MNKIKEIGKMILFLVISFVVITILLKLFWGKVYSIEGFYTGYLIQILYQFAITVISLLIAFLFVKAEKRKLKDIGINLNIEGIKAFLKGLVIAGFAGFLTWLWLFIQYHPEYSLSSIGIEKIILSIVFTFIVTVFQVSYEEIVTRSYLAEKLGKLISPIGATILIAIIFASFHLMNPRYSSLGILSVFFSGILYTMAYYRSKSTFIAIGAHLGWNFIFGGILLNHTIFEISKIQGLRLSTTGFEATIPGVIFPALACVVLYYWTKKKKINIY